MKILFLGETYRADAITWIKGIEKASGLKIETAEITSSQTRLNRIFHSFQFLFFLIKLRGQKEYDLVLAERATSYGFFSLFVKTNFRIVAQQGITDAYPESGLSGFFKRRLQNWVYKRVDLIHAWGPVMLEAIFASGVSLSRIVVLPKGINLALYQMRNPVLTTSLTGIVTRSLADVYRHDVILEAMAILQKEQFDFNCLIVGDGPLRASLEMKAEHLGIASKVHFLGRINNDELPHLLQKSEIYLSMPETEGVSSSLFEAMASGSLPIVTDIRGNRQFIRSIKNGILVTSGDSSQLASSIKKAVKDYDRSILRDFL